jgi:hypothetical protein
LSRLRILTIFVALIALATAFAACGSGSSSSPQAIVDEATLQGIESGKIDLTVGVGLKGEKSGHVNASLSGAFQSESEAELPELDLTATAKGSVGGEKIDFDGGFTLLGGNKAYVGYEGTEYEVDPTTFSYVQSLAKKQGTGGEKSSEVTACQEAAGELKIADFIENLSEGGSADVGGTSTTKVSGDLNASGALDALSELVEDPACSEQLEAAGSVPSAAELDAAKGTVKDAVKDAHVELYVGDDHIVRRMIVKATIEPPAGSGGGVSSVELDLDLTLTGVNEDQTISPPASSKPLSDLFLKLNVNPIELLGAVQGGAGGIGGLLEGIGGAGGGSSNGGSGGSGSSGGSSGGGQQAYYECLREAHTPVDIQNCTGKLQ